MAICLSTLLHISVVSLFFQPSSVSSVEACMHVFILLVQSSNFTVDVGIKQYCKFVQVIFNMFPVAMALSVYGSQQLWLATAVALNGYGSQWL